MTKQEAYQRLRVLVDEINNLRREAEKFARENGLAMGTLRHDPTSVGVAEPPEFKKNKNEDNDEDWDSSDSHWDEADDDDFISSQVCW